MHILLSESTVMHLISIQSFYMNFFGGKLYLLELFTINAPNCVLMAKSVNWS